VPLGLAGEVVHQEADNQATNRGHDDELLGRIGDERFAATPGVVADVADEVQEAAKTDGAEAGEYPHHDRRTQGDGGLRDLASVQPAGQRSAHSAGPPWVFRRCV